MRTNLLSRLFAAVLIAGATTTSFAQWQTQTFNLKPGWNAIFMHVDASHDTVNALAGVVAIDEIWLWKPDVSTVQFVTSPQEPIDGGSQWLVWKSGIPAETTLGTLVGNAAYLVKVGGASDITWSVKGKPVPPRHIWTTSGVNFIGYSSPSGSAPNLEAFLAAATGKLQDLEHYQYVGGALSENPKKVVALRTTTIDRGKAFWVKSKSASFNRYFGPFQVSLQNNQGVHFGADQGRYRIRIKNLVDQELSVSASTAASEAAPAGETAVQGQPPLLVRGSLNTTNLTYGSAALTNGTSWTLQPVGQVGSEVEIVLGLDRSTMGGAEGDLFAGILSFADSLGFSQVDLPISATVASKAGLWVGDAVVNQVQHNLIAYQKTGDTVVQDENGQYVRSSTNSTFGTVARPYPLRLILHHATNETVLMQRVFHGIGLGTNAVLTTAESQLSPHFMELAGRISVTHLPWSAGNTTWSFTGDFEQDANITVSVDVDYDSHASNPFVHTYHPDHDNLNAKFDGKLAKGYESFEIKRDITLTFEAPGDDFDSRTSGEKTRNGTYLETVTLSGLPGYERQYFTRGSFSLNRISEIASLTRP